MSNHRILVVIALFSFFGFDSVEVENHNPLTIVTTDCDSPSFFYILDFGLRSIENPSYGGLAGRFVQSKSNLNRWEDRSDAADINPFTGQFDTSFPHVRWIPVPQNDFAARAAWSVKGYNDANQASIVMLNHLADIITSASDLVKLSGLGNDPDGNQLQYAWWQYTETDLNNDQVIIRDAHKLNEATMVFP